MEAQTPPGGNCSTFGSMPPRALNDWYKNFVAEVRLHCATESLHGLLFFSAGGRESSGADHTVEKEGSRLASDWIQSRDSAFREQADRLIAVITNYCAIWGLTPEDLTPLRECHTNFLATLAEQAEQAAIYHARVADKQAKREELERVLRVMVRRINNHPGMTDTLRQQMSLASPTRTSTRRATRRAIGEVSGKGDG